MSADMTNARRRMAVTLLRQRRGPLVVRMQRVTLRRLHHRQIERGQLIPGDVRAIVKGGGTEPGGHRQRQKQANDKQRKTRQGGFPNVTIIITCKLPAAA